MWVPSKSTHHFFRAQMIDNSSCSCVEYLHCWAFICWDLKATGCTHSQVSPKLKQAPILHWLASQVTQIFFLPGLSWSIVVKQSALSTRSLIHKKAASCCTVQGGNKALQDFDVNGVSMLVYSMSFGRKTLIYHTRPERHTPPSQIEAISSSRSFLFFQGLLWYHVWRSDVQGNPLLPETRTSSLVSREVRPPSVFPSLFWCCICVLV